MEHMTLEELLAKAEWVVKFLRTEREYTRVELNFIALRKEGATFHINAYDDFQDSLSYEDRYEHGGLPFDLEELNAMLLAHPGRAKREFTVMRKRLANISQFSDKLVSLAGKAFFEEISGTLTKYDLIEDQR